MPILLLPCKSRCFPNLPLSLNNYTSAYYQLQSVVFPANSKCPAPKITCFYPLFSIGSPVSSIFCKNSQNLASTHLTFSSRNNVFNVSSTQLSKNREDYITEGNEELELLHKPSPTPISKESVPEVDDKEFDKDEVLEPFLKFFKPRDTIEELGEEENELEISEENSDLDAKDDEEAKKVNVEYYEPKPGDFVVGVVVSGNENKLDVNVGADFLGTMLTKEVLPLYDKEMEYLLCDTTEEFMVRGKLGIVKNDEAISGGSLPGKPVVETGTVLFAEVLGRTLSGRPLLSTRRLFRRIAWHRVRQIKQINEPVEVRITEWNTGGLLTRIEGLRAFLPKAELLKRVNSFTELKENVGRQMYVQITRINEDTNDFILSEKEAWEILNLREGTLLEGTVKKIFPYGAQIRIGETNRSGLLHISNISRARITSVSDLLTVDEKVKVLVLKPTFPDKISLSIGDLESEPGLFISNKERVFSEAEMMAKKYRQKLPAGLANQKSESTPNDSLNFENEATMYANWKWFKFEKECQLN